MGVTVMDPIIEKDGQWFFSDENWSDIIGPFNTEEIARHQLAEYVKYLNEGSELICKTMAEWINKLADAHDAGKKVTLNDNPLDRLLGFKVGGTTISVSLVLAQGRGWNTTEGLKALKRIDFDDYSFGHSLQSPGRREALVTKLYHVKRKYCRGGDRK